MVASSGEWGEGEWGELEWGAAAAWGARENGDPADTSSPLIPIPPGSLEAIQTATDRIWKQYESTASWPAIMETIGEAFAELDVTLAKVDLRRYRSTAQGAQLDEVGAAVGRARGSLTDDDQYRVAILVDTATLFSSGTIPELLELANLLTDQPAELTEFFPAAIRLRLPDLDASTFDLLVDILADVPAAGVAALLSTYDSDAVGGWSSTYGAVDTPAAWSSTYGATTNTRAHWATAREIGS